MKINADWLSRPETQSVMNLLEVAGHQAVFVGGCVRNTLLNAPVKDIDIATDALPDQVMTLAKDAGLGAIPTGIDHGTVTVVANHIAHEVTTFRKDVETDGRHARVVYSADILEDARRRDFTMNALYATATGTLLDPLGGLPDLEARHVRFIEDPAQRIREDYLRILRFFRFHAWYGDAEAGMDAEALAAIATHLDGLADLSRERAGSEIIRLLKASDPAPAVAAMAQSGVLGRILPGAQATALAPLVHLETEVTTAPDAIRRLAALGGEDVAERLRLSKVQARKLDQLRAAMADPMPPLELGYRLGAPDGLSALLLRAALFEQPLSPEGASDVARGAELSFPLTARDLMPALTGSALGARLRTLEARWLASGATLSREALLSDD